MRDEWTVETEQGGCRAYLDKCAPKSLLYIRYVQLCPSPDCELSEDSFGSVIFAPLPQQVSILIDVLEELEIPFIMAEGNAPDEVKEMMRSRIGKGKNKGLLAVWTPQRAILSHPVSIDGYAWETCLCWHSLPGCS